MRIRGLLKGELPQFPVNCCAEAGLLVEELLGFKAVGSTRPAYPYDLHLVNYVRESDFYVDITPDQYPDQRDVQIKVFRGGDSYCTLWKPDVDIRQYMIDTLTAPKHFGVVERVVKRAREDLLFKVE